MGSPKTEPGSKLRHLDGFLHLMELAGDEVPIPDYDYKEAERLLKESGVGILHAESAGRLVGVGGRCHYPAALLQVEAGRLGVYELDVDGVGHVIKLDEDDPQNLTTLLGKVVGCRDLLTCQHIPRLKYIAYLESVRKWGLVMERLDGFTLRHPRFTEVFGEDLGPRYRALAEIAVGLADLSARGYDYVDMHPENFMVTTTGRAYVIDYDDLSRMEPESKEETDRQNRGAFLAEVAVPFLLNRRYYGRDVTRAELVSGNVDEGVVSLLLSDDHDWETVIRVFKRAWSELVVRDRKTT